MKFQDQILSIIAENSGLSSSEVHAKIGAEKSYTTTKRMLATLVSKKLLDKLGTGKGTKYQLSKSYGILHSVDMEKYFELEIDERQIKASFNFELLEIDLHQVDIFTGSELEELELLQSTYLKNVAELSKEEYSKEVERLAIDLSWKSSQI